MRTRKQRRTRKRGGKRLGRGVSGIVYTPVLQCDNNSHIEFDGPTYVSKAVPGHKVESELANADAVRTLDPAGEYTIVPLHSCELARLQTNTNFLRNKNDPSNTYENNEIRMGQRKIYTHQVIYRNGGRSLVRWFGERKHHASVIVAIKEFIPHLVEFNKHYIHFDLHMDNLVFDGSPVRMIDFEKMGPARPDLQKADLCSFLPHLYSVLNQYSQKETCDTTYTGWLETYRNFGKYSHCRKNVSVEEIVACFMALPIVQKKSVGCSIMG